MDAAVDLTSYAHALGRAQAAWRFAGAELRRASALAAISKAWGIFRRDAGAGDVGPAHEARPAAAQLLVTEDPRRDSVLLWLADHAAPAIAEAAAMVARMVGATRRFDVEEYALLDAARDALANPAVTAEPIARMITGGARSNDAVLEPLRTVAAALDRLRGDAAFLEGEGAEVRHTLPTGAFSHFVPAEPGGCWALNLALLCQGGQSVGVPAPPGLVSRTLFRSDLELEEIAVQLVTDASAAWSGTYDQLVRLKLELARGHDALAHLSRNARTRDAWLLVAASGTCTRSQLARALGLSRAGADIQAHALAGSGLVTLVAGGQIAWARVRSTEVVPESLDQEPLGDAMSDLNARLADIDRLLARSAR